MVRYDITRGDLGESAGPDKPQARSWAGEALGAGDAHEGLRKRPGDGVKRLDVRAFGAGGLERIFQQGDGQVPIPGGQGRGQECADTADELKVLF